MPMASPHPANDTGIRFYEDLGIMEIRLGDFPMTTSAAVNRLYDRIEERIAESGEDLWFFLVDYCNAWIEPDAWFAFARRGKALNEAHSMGTVRFDASDATRKQIEASANTERFDPNLFSDRESAIRRLEQMPSLRPQARKPIEQLLSFADLDLQGRVRFDEDQQVAEIDVSELCFKHARDVDFFYDFLESEFRSTGRKWFFLINYDGTRIEPAAWSRYAARGKALNLKTSMGSVRYAPGSETEQDIRLRAEGQNFDPNIRNTREEAIKRLNELRTQT